MPGRREVLKGIGAVTVLGTVGTVGATHFAPELVPDDIERAILKAEEEAKGLAAGGIDSVVGLAKSTLDGAVAEVKQIPGKIGADLAERSIEMFVDIEETEATNELLRARLILELAFSAAERSRGDKLLVVINDMLGVDRLRQNIETEVNNAVKTLDDVGNDLSKAATTTVDDVGNTINGFSNDISNTAKVVYNQEILGIKVGNLTEALAQFGGPLQGFAVAFDKLAQEAPEEDKQGQQKTGELKTTLTSSAGKLDGVIGQTADQGKQSPSTGLVEVHGTLGEISAIEDKATTTTVSAQRDRDKALATEKQNYKQTIDALRKDHPDQVDAVVQRLDAYTTQDKGIGDAVMEGAKEKALDVAELLVENQILIARIELERAVSTAERARADAFLAIVEGMEEFDALRQQLESTLKTTLQSLDKVRTDLSDSISKTLKPIADVINDFAVDIANTAKVVYNQEVLGVKVGNLTEAIERLELPLVEIKPLKVFAKTFDDLAKNTPQKGKQGQEKADELKKTLSTSVEKVDEVIGQTSDPKKRSQPSGLIGAQESLSHITVIEENASKAKERIDKDYKETLGKDNQDYRIEITRIQEKYKSKVNISLNPDGSYSVSSVETK